MDLKWDPDNPFVKKNRLLVLRLVEAAYAAPFPFVMNTPVCGFTLWWTANDPSMCHLTESVQLCSRISPRCLVACRYSIVRQSLCQSCSMGCCILVHRNDTAVCKPGYARLERKKDFAIKWWNSSSCPSSSLGDLSLILNALGDNVSTPVISGA